MPPGTTLGLRLKSQIESKYEELGYTLGWRLLYSPESVLERSRVAFVGMNPGGDRAPDHAEFAMEMGSAYALERWGAPPGKSKLQHQVLSLFKIIDEPAERVLAGNLVPFRSPSWSALEKKEEALGFGKEVWREILANSTPRLVIAMGREAADGLKSLLDVRKTHRLLIGWGNCTAEQCVFAGGTLVCIPHLSRFTVATRKESQEPLRRLLGEHVRN